MHVFAGPVLLESGGMGMHVVPLPAEIDAALADAGAVVGTLNDVPFRRAIHGRKDGAPRLRFGKAVLRQAGLALGETAFVELEAADPDAVRVPAELAAALAQDPEARERWDTFTPGRQRSIATIADRAKRPETRERRALDLARQIRTRTLPTDKA